MADALPRPDVLALSEEDLAHWREQIAQARAVRGTIQVWAEANLKAYAPSVDTSPDEYGLNLNTNRDFTLVERKKADLFYQSPEIAAKASPLFAGHEELLDTHVAILNEKLGLDGVNAKAMVHQVLFDILCPWGTGFTIMGYESTTVDTPVLDAMGQPAMDPMTGMPQMAPVPVHEDCFWRWFSPKKALIPADFDSTMWDDAPWVGMEFEMPLRMAKRKGWCPPDYAGTPVSSEIRFSNGASKSGDNVARGVVIYYKSALYRDDQVHPQHQTYLVLMDEASERGDWMHPAEHKDSPYQSLDGKGALTPDSLIGFPIHPCTLRTQTDSSYVASDCTISRPLVNELNRFRGQMIQHRDANGLRWTYNTDTLPTDALAKIVRAPIGGMIGLPDEAFAGDGAIRELPQGSYGRENLQFNDYIDNDLARTHALDSNQQGVTDQSGTTATEAQIQQSNVNARLGLERGNVLDWYVRGVTKFSTLVQRFLPVQEAAKIVGAQDAQMWSQWVKTVPSSLAFTAMPDSALRSDTAADRKTATDLYSFLANDPNVDRTALLKDVLRKHHFNPSKIVVQPPPPSPPPPTFSMAIKSESLNPMMPEYPNIYQVLTQAGVKGLLAPVPESILNQPTEGPNAQTEHGGKVAPQESLSKHSADITGNMQGSGQPAPMGAGGGAM